MEVHYVLVLVKDIKSLVSVRLGIFKELKLRMVMVQVLSPCWIYNQTRGVQLNVLYLFPFLWELIIFSASMVVHLHLLGDVLDYLLPWIILLIIVVHLSLLATLVLFFIEHVIIEESLCRMKP